MAASVQKRAWANGRVEADRVRCDLVAQRLQLFGESLRLLVAHGCVERRDHVEQPSLAGGVAERQQGQSGTDALEIGRLVARLELGPDQRHRVALERHFAFAGLGHGCLIKEVRNGNTKSLVTKSYPG